MQTMLMKEELKDSCQNICGKWQALPCSCDPKCLVFSNCCEDFEVECSGMAEESKSNYAGLLNSEVKCINSIFVITSCSFTDTESQNSTSLEDSNKKPKVQTKQRKLLTDFLLNKIPVLDVSTGFSFDNNTIFNCNGGNLSNALIWDILVKKFEIIYDFQTKEILLENLTNNENNWVYQPPFQYKNPIRRNCLDVSAGICSKTEHPLYSKCKSFISYVITHIDKRPIFFNNKYCAQCNGFTNVSVFKDTFRYMNHNSDFEVLVSVSRESIDLVGRNQKVGSFWNIIQCTKSGNQDLQCDAICPTGLVFRPYKACKKPLSLQIAISTNIILPGKTDVKIWTNYVHCFLTQVLEVDIETVLNYSKVDRFYNNEESFYWIEMIAYEKGSVYKPQFKTIRHSFDLLADSLSKIVATTESKNLIFKPNSSLESIKMCGFVVDIKQKLLNPNEYDDVLFCRDIFLTTGQETVKTQNSCHIQFSRCSSIHFFLFYFPIQLSGLLIVSFFLNS
ncbi:hypothetical protein BgiBS90_026039 [Biomphalaria glabrata]|nr:hypothetical protein BgiBS90_026039 [Biomphalaria glabrata]